MAGMYSSRYLMNVNKYSCVGILLYIAFFLSLTMYCKDFPGGPVAKTALPMQGA